MLSQIQGNIILAILVIFAIAAFIVFVIGIKFMVKTFKKSDKKTKISSVLTVVAVIIAAASWIFNMGWLRLILTIFLVPFIHATVLIVVSMIATKFYKTSNVMSLYNTLYLSTYAVSYVCLPDFDDVKVYSFFTLVRYGGILMNICCIILLIAVILHALVFVLIIIEMIKCKRRSKSIPVLKDAGGSNEET